MSDDMNTVTNVPQPPTHDDVQARLNIVNQTVYSVELQDLLAEPLLLSAPRMEFNGQVVPCLGGIPLLAKLGQGGMAAVYFGIHTRLMLEVAVKVLPIHMAHDDPSLVQRFLREGQIAAKVKSPNLVSVLDVNEDKGVHYLVMEFINGMTAGAYCRERISKAGAVGVDEVTTLDICIAAAEGLAVAHAAGIVHRDIKPDNILIPRLKSGEALNFSGAKLSDLGLARKDQSMHSLTGAQNVMGTPGYMAPEQATDAKNAVQSSDIFSMGATAYSLLCGQPPFIGETTLEAVINTIQKAHRPIGQLRGDISIETAAVIDRCLHKKPDRRCQDGAALLKALQQCRANLVVNKEALPLLRSPTKVIPVEKAEPPAAAVAASARRTEERVKTAPARSGAGTKIIFVMLALVMLAGGYWLMKIHDSNVAARKAEEEEEQRATAQRLEEEHRAKEQRDQAERTAKLQKEEREAQEQRQKALQDAEAALSHSGGTGTVGNVGTVKNEKPTPAVAATTASHPEFDSRKAKIDQLMTVLKAADAAAQKAINEQTKAAEQAEKASERRRTASDALQKAQSASRAAATAANKASEAARRAPRNSDLADEADQRLKDFQVAEDAATKADQNYQAADKHYDNSDAAYRATTTAAAKKIAERTKAEEKYNAAVEETNRWIKENFSK